MKILATYRHYWPDTTPYARLLRAILENMVLQGHSATVFTAQPSYNDIASPKQPSREELGGVDVRRVRLLPERKHLYVLRVINSLFFLVRTCFHVLWHREYDLIIANTHPPIIMGTALRLLRRLTGTPYLLHCQDIHPESALIANQLQSGSVARLFYRMDTKNCAKACRVVTLSDDMKKTLQSRKGYSGSNIVVINNFALDVYQATNKIPRQFSNNHNKPFRVFFAGNMGHFQDLLRLIQAAEVMKGISEITFVFMGAGAELLSLKQSAMGLIGKTVFFEDFQSVETAYACMQHADLGVVSLRDGVSRVAYPSKTMTYLAAGCPLLLLAEPESQLASDVRGHNFGYVPNSLTAESIAKTILDAYRDRKQWSDAARHELVDRAEKCFGKQRALNQWSDLLEEISFEEKLPSVALPEQPASRLSAA